MHHAFDPDGIGGAAAHHARNFLDQRAGLGSFRARGVGVVERRRDAELLGSGSESAFEGGIVEAFEQIDLGVILDMQEGVGLRHTRGEADLVANTIDAFAVGGR